MKKTVKSRLIAVYGDKVLVLKKVGDPLRYTLPGGAKKAKESPAGTLIREVREEIKLKLAEAQIEFLFSQTKKGNGGHHLKHYFLIELEQAPIKVREKDKFEAALWLEWKEALPFMDKMDRKAVRYHFKGAANKTKKANGNKVPPRIAM